MGEALRLRDIAKSYGGPRVIDGLSLDVASGEFLVLLGPSGCGKSTLLRAIAGLEDLDAGSIHLGEDRIDTLPPGRRGVAMVFQLYALYPHMSVRENMSFGLRNAGTDTQVIEDRVSAAAASLEIEPLLDRKPGQLSGGQRQRVAIARAIVKEPKLFLLDEPLSNLDAALRTRTRLELAQLHKRLAATIVFVTHDQVERGATALPQDPGGAVGAIMRLGTSIISFANSGPPRLRLLHSVEHGRADGVTRPRAVRF